MQDSRESISNNEPFAGSTRVKELLYRSEAERLHLQHAAASLAHDRQQLGADVHSLQQQLVKAHSAFVDSQQQCQQLSVAKNELQQQLVAAVREYRASDIICCGLRDQITCLQQKLTESQQTCQQQASTMATCSDDLNGLRQCRADLSSHLLNLQQQHQQLQAAHRTAVQELADTRLELADNRQRWLDEYGDTARHLQDLQESKEQLQLTLDDMEGRMQERQQQLEQQTVRANEYECEVHDVRGTVMLLAKAIGKQPRAQELPGHEDPIWTKLGPLGGVQHALEVVVKHIRVQDTRLKIMKTDVDRLEDRVRSESAQKAELQGGLYEVRGLYAKAVADREALEARAARAEADKAAADTNWQRAQAQATEDSTRLKELQESVMALTKQVQQLLPLRPHCSTLELERDTTQHKLDRLQEQYDQVQRQLQQEVAQESELRASLDTYKVEHMQLLAANAQLVEKCQDLNKKLQVLEITAREGSIAVGQLEAARQKLSNTQNQLEVMNDNQIQTLKRLETAKAMLQGSHSNSAVSSVASSPCDSSRTSSRHTTHVDALSDSSFNQRAADAAVISADAASPPCYDRNIDSAPSLTQHATAGAASSTEAAASGGGGVSMAAEHPRDPQELLSSTTAAAPAVFSVVGHRGVLPRDRDPDEAEMELDLASLPTELAALLREKGLMQHFSNKQKKWHEVKVSVISWFADQLRKKLLSQTEHSRQLEVQLLQQEVDHIQQLLQQEQLVSQQCLGAALEAQQAMRQLVTNLQTRLLLEEEAGSSDPSKPQCWLQPALAAMGSYMQACAARELKRAEQLATRQEVAVQTDQPVDDDWLCLVTSLPSASITHTLHVKAIHEAIVRIYIRALHEAEVAWARVQLHRQGRPVSRKGGASPAIASGNSGTGSLSTLFDCMMAHYAQQQQQRGRPQAYEASLWRDPQGPICRLLVSCRPLTASSSKIALFCCFAGTYATSNDKPWGMAYWQQFLLILHATKRLVGASWKGILRDWSTSAGVCLPLQCAHDLLGNVYNVSELSELDRLPAWLQSKGRVLHPETSPAPPTSGAATQAAGAAGLAHPASTAAQPPSEAAAGAVCCDQRAPASPESASGTAAGPGNGSVATALTELVVDGPVGPAVDLDDLLMMLMKQYEAGLLPGHPLLEPRRLTDGTLSNTTNAWGSAAAEATALPAETGRARLGPTAGWPDSRGGSSSVGFSPSLFEGNDWNLPSCTSGISSAGGWLSRPTTGAAYSRAASGISAATVETSCGEPGPITGLLPHIRTPDSNTRSANGYVATAATSSLSQYTRHPHLTSADIGNCSSSSSLTNLASPGAAVMKTGMWRSGSRHDVGAKVGFKNTPSSAASSSVSATGNSVAKSPSTRGPS